MSRKRSIHPNMFCDENFLQLSPEMRLFLLMLGTESDYADRFKWDAAIKRALDTGVIQWPGVALASLEADGYVRRDGDVGEILFGFGFNRRRVSLWEKIRSRIFERDQWACTYCGEVTSDLHCDHVVPVSKGGGNEDTNLTTACKHCNLSKGPKRLEDWRR